MSDFKKIGCGTCPARTDFTDCEGVPILSNATLATCADLSKIDPNKPVEPSDYCPSVKIACAGQYGYGYGPDDIKDPAATVEMKDCDGAVICYIYPTSAAGHTIAIKDCDGVLVGYSANASSCACSLVTISGTQATGNRIATVTINGVPTDIKETITTLESVTFDEATRTLSVTYKGEDGISVTKQENIPAIDAVIHIAPAVITPPTKYPEYYNKIVTDANGNFWAFSIDGTPTLLNITETVTTIFDVLAYANKHEIFKYKNESGLEKPVYETVTTLKSLSYAKATNILTVVYTDENGTDITKTAEIKDLTNVFINGTNPNSSTIFSTTTPPTVTDNTLKQGTDYIYVGTDGSYWIWNGTAYVTAPTPAATTEWNFGGTAVDAKGDKINPISRSGWVFVGANKVPTCPVDIENTSPGTSFMNVVRMIASNQASPGRTTMFTMGAKQSVGDLADWRFYYAGPASPKNRSEFGFTGNAYPNLVMLYSGLNGVGTNDPLHRWDVGGSFGFAIRGSGGSATQGPQDGTVVFTVASSVYTLEAPSAATNVRRFITVKNAATGNITVVGNIDGVAGTTLIIPVGGGAIFHSNGNSWWRVADNERTAHTNLYRVSARVGRGVDVTLDNLKFRVAASGNASLQASTVAGTVTLNGTSEANTEAYGLLTQVAFTTTPAYVRAGVTLALAGQIQRFLFVTDDNKSYEVRMVVAPGWVNNLIHIERLA